MTWLVSPRDNLAETFCNIIGLVKSKQIQTDATSKRIIKCDLNSIIRPCRHRIYYFDYVYSQSIVLSDENDVSGQRYRSVTLSNSGNFLLSFNRWLYVFEHDKFTTDNDRRILGITSCERARYFDKLFILYE